MMDNGTDFFDLLESNQPSVVDNFKELIQEHISSVKESWLVNGLFDYYLQTNSDRCMDVLIGVSKEPHDKFLIEKILEGLRVQSSRKSSLTFLGHLIRKQPAWLYKVISHGLLKELLSILKTDTDIVVLLTGLLAITSLLPILPMYLIKYTNEIFDVFGRLTTWAHTSHNIPEEHLLHLQVGLYSLFHRLYAMYPCNFLSYLRHTFGNSDKRVVFTNTIKPMLETVKMHPMLVTATKEGELSLNRWKNKAYDDIIAECALVSLDVLESGLPEEVNPIQLRPRMSTSNIVSDGPGNDSAVPSILRVPVSSIIQQSLLKSEITDLSSIAYLTEDSAPPTPSSFNVNSSSSSVTNPYHAALTAASTKSTASPPETAMEATPENTPIQTPVKDKHIPAPFKLLPTSPAVKHLNFGKTPPGSVPSSPAPHQAEYSRRDSIFDTALMRRDSLLMGRLEKIMLEQQGPSGLVQEPTKKTSPLTLDSTNLITVPGMTATGTTVQTAPGFLSAPTHDSAIGGSESLIGGPLTPMLGGTFTHSDSTKDVSDDEVDELRNTTRAMPDKESLMAFAQRVKRLRFYSQCTDLGSSGGGPSPGSSPSSTFLTAHRVKRSNSCPDVYKKNNDGTGPSSTDSVDGIQTPSHQMELSEDTTTPKTEAVQPYEHLFETVLPSFLQHPGENSAQISSPHRLLDLCINKAAALHGMSGKTDEMTLLRGQVELLHAQLLFERHRREAHALRNRSLAKRCRAFQQQEERNYSLEIQLNTFDKEVATLKKELMSQRNACALKEQEYQKTISSLESKVEDLMNNIRNLKDEKFQDDSKFTKLSDDFQVVQKEIDQKKADIFQLESEIKEYKKYVIMNSRLKTALETQQKEVLLLGELYRKQQETLNSLESNRYVLHEMEDLRLTCEHEITDLKNMLESKSSQMEACLGLVQDLERDLNEKDQIILKERKIVDDATAEYQIQIKALEDKYESIKSINHRLELEILNLQHQLTVKSFTPGRPNVGRRISPANGDSPHNSTNSDVDSAASAGGFQLSPDQSMFIFGSPQFGPAPMEMNDLQRVIGESEATNAERPNNSPRRTAGRGGGGGPSTSRMNSNIW